MKVRYILVQEYLQVVFDTILFYFKLFFVSKLKITKHGKKKSCCINTKETRLERKEEKELITITGNSLIKGNSKKA